jgi:hypothetical protein
MREEREVLTTMRLSLRRTAVALSERHWVLWSWRRVREVPRKASGVSFEAIVVAFALWLMMAAMGQLKMSTILAVAELGLTNQRRPVSHSCDDTSSVIFNHHNHMTIWDSCPGGRQLSRPIALLSAVLILRFLDDIQQRGISLAPA